MYVRLTDALARHFWVIYVLALAVPLGTLAYWDGYVQGTLTVTPVCEARPVHIYRDGRYVESRR